MAPEGGWGAMVLAAAALLAAGECAWAGLGGDAASVQGDRVHLKAQSNGVNSLGSYTVEELQIPSGTVVKEYVSSSGKVFAVSWRGPTVPDLRQLLGPYFAQYESAASEPHTSHRQLTVRQSDLVVQSTGRMRAFFGRAYVPSLLPSGFQLQDIH